MKKLFILSIFVFFSLNLRAQLFTLEFNINFRHADSSLMEMPLVGGINQGQFSNIDLNGDGLQDILVFDRTGAKKMCFIAKQQAGVTSYFYDPVYEDLFPLASEFMFAHDYNGDFLPDLWMYDGFTQKVQLYKNTTATFPQFTWKSNLRAYNFNNPPFDSTDFIQFKGNYPDIVDLDGDGDLDYVSNSAYCGSNLTYYRNTTEERGWSLENTTFEIPDYCLGNLAEDGIEVTINAKCNYQKHYNWKKHCGVKTLGFFDNDGDGDLDLFFGTSEQWTNPMYFIENGKSDFSMQYDTFILIDTAYFDPAVEPLIPISAASAFIDINQDGIKDLILSTNEQSTIDYPVMQTNNVLYFHNAGSNDIPDFQFQQNDFLVGEMVDFGAHTAPTFVDLDGDGDQDLVIGTNGDDFSTNDTMYHLVYLENVGSKNKADFIIRDLNFLDMKQYRWKYINPNFADIDGDDDFDLFIGKIDGTISYFENTGSTTNAAFSLNTHSFSGIGVGEQAAPYFYDLNKDGLLDLLVGEYEGNINYYENQGTSASANLVLIDDSLGSMLSNELIHQTIIDGNGIRDTLVYNYFGSSSLGIGVLQDDSLAVIVGGADGQLRIFKVNNDLSKKFTQDSAQLYHSLKQSIYIKDFGANAMPAVADLDHDGYSDILLGNNRGGLNYLYGRNTSSINRLKLNKARFNVFPNPSNGALNLILENTHEKYSYSITDISGRQLQQGKNQLSREISLNEQISNGIYFIHVNVKGKQYSSQKFVVIR